MNNENVTIPHRQSFFQILWFKNCKPLITHQNNGHLLFQKIVFQFQIIYFIFIFSFRFYKVYERRRSYFC